jgi:hypothetical protein
MIGSAVIARISAVADAIRSPVAMYGTAPISVTRVTRSRRRMRNERAVSSCSGSRSRAP